MDQNLDLIKLLAVGLTAALVLGYITQRLRLSPIVGYLLAGVLIGPSTPGFIGDLHLSHQLAEIGVILMMFGVGLHFHLKDLLAVKGVALPGAIGQSLVATLLAVAIFGLFGFPWQTGVVIGMALAVASTVVLMRGLMDHDLLDSKPGHVAVGWLIVEDIFTVVLLMLIPVLGKQFGTGSSEIEDTQQLSLWPMLGLTFLKLSVLVGLVLIVGARVIPRVMVHVARLRSRELFTLTVLVISIAVAAGSYYAFGASMALGAFLAGMVVAQSPVSHQAAADALPMRDAFSVLFFVSVGMLFDPSYLWNSPLVVLAALAIVLIAKPISALLIVVLLGHSSRTALTVAIGLAQIGEFSFILSDLARQNGLMPETGQNLLVATAIISITLNPLLFELLPRLEALLKTYPRLHRLLNARAAARIVASNQQVQSQLADTKQSSAPLALIVGYGPVGRSVHRLLKEAKHSTVIIDMNMDTVSTLVAQGQTAVFGDASHEGILSQAGMRRASHLVLTLPQTTDRASVVATARNLNPDTRILVRAKYISERDDLEQAGATAAVFEEIEAAVALSRLVLADTGFRREATEEKIKDLRLHLIQENVSNLRSHRVQSVMVPWSRVRWLPGSADQTFVLSQVSQMRFSRWPVVEAGSQTPTSYLFTRDLIAGAATTDWKQLVRPLKSVDPADSVEHVLSRMQSEGDTIYVVSQGKEAMGLVTLEDILEQVFGRIEDEYPHQTPVSLAESIGNGAVLYDLRSATAAEAMDELIASIPKESLPASVDRGELVQIVLQREEQFSTDLGNGVALPHLRSLDIARPIVIVGRSSRGIDFSGHALVHLIFLLITPDEQPEMQLSLLGQLGQLCRDESTREALRHCSSELELRTLLQST